MDKIYLEVGRVNSISSIPKNAVIAILDMLDNCARIRPGQEVLLLAHTDGLYGSDNMVDVNAISWIEALVKARGANASVLWIDEPAKAHAWRVPPIVKSAYRACDVFINHSFDIVTEEILEFRELIAECEIPMVRNFATTGPLLCSQWAMTPYELVSEIRYQASLAFKDEAAWQITDENGTFLAGTISPQPKYPAGMPYSSRREEFGYYFPWPEWVHPPIGVADVSGTFVFEKMLSWWSRYIGISPYFSRPVELTIKDCRIEKIKGGNEADALQRFLRAMEKRLGAAVYDFNCLHFGVHPQAFVAPHQCPNILHRRLIEHSHASNIHVHIGAPPATPDYPYWMHCTGDINTATFRVGEILVHDQGRLTALDSPEVMEIKQKYPDRPGLLQEPVSV